MAKEKENATVETPVQAAPAAKPSVKVTGVQRSIYVGPARPYGLPLMNRAVLMPGAAVGGLKEALAAHPALGKLFVGIDALASARAALLRDGDPLRVAYETVQKETLAQRKATGGK